VDIGAEPLDAQSPPAKRRLIDQRSKASKSHSPQLITQRLPSPIKEVKPALQEPQTSKAKLVIDHGVQAVGSFLETPPEPASIVLPSVDVIEKASDLLSHTSRDETGHDEEAVVYTSARMLEDPTGRLRKFPINFPIGLNTIPRPISWWCNRPI
jgi:hypothetical protein